MTPSATGLVAVLVAAATPLAGAPLAAADPLWPVTGAQSAGVTIDELQPQGYNVQINWISGISSVPLDREFSTVYVDVSCPNRDDGPGRLG